LLLLGTADSQPTVTMRITSDIAIRARAAINLLPLLTGLNLMPLGAVIGDNEKSLIWASGYYKVSRYRGQLWSALHVQVTA
jgi:hypothetical protein